MMARRPLVVERYLDGLKAKEIHQLLVDEDGIKCSLDTVYRDIEALEAEWVKQLVKDPVTLKARELADIDRAELECWDRYKQASGRVKRIWLSELRSWKERKAKLLGLDAPAKVRLEGELIFTVSFDGDDDSR